MPVHAVKGGGKQWGSHGKVYRGKGAETKAAAQGRVAYANGYRGDGRQGPEQDREDAEPTFVDFYTGEPVES